MISYLSSRDAGGQFFKELTSLIEGGAKRFCDVGGGARPAVSLAQIQRFGLEYVVLDEAQDRLDLLPAGYETFRADVLDRAAVAELVRARGPFDVVVSRWAAEHIRDGRGFHEQVFAMLRPGGTAVHYFPTLYSPPFLLNRLLPGQLSAPLLFRVFPVRENKWRPYYSWCRGPTAGQLRRLEALGFRLDRYVGFFGHGFYQRYGALQRAHAALSELLLKHPLPALTSFALVVLSRPAD
jgi:SAM-dependent methyltransferase